MKKTAILLSTAGVLALAVAMPRPAEAAWRGGFGPAFAAGAVLGGLAASSAYAWAPGYGYYGLAYYGYGPGYYYQGGNCPAQGYGRYYNCGAYAMPGYPP